MHRRWGLPARSRALLVVLALASAIAGCGSSDPTRVSGTVATLEPVRGAVTIAGTASDRLERLASDRDIATPAGTLARLVLDEGPRLLLDGATKLAPLGDGEVRFDEGRMYAEVGATDVLVVRAGDATLRLQDASASLERHGGNVVAYVVSGELAYARGRVREVARPGEELTLAVAANGAAPTRTPKRLWSDWTGGLARPGPHGGEDPHGVGTLEARVPDEVGEARWPLVMRRLDARVNIVDDLAVTEVEQIFFNPASESVEGLYRIRVPEGAVLQRFAVDRAGVLVDGYVREKEQARAAYQAQVYRGSTLDPALLEWDAPGSYRARIYPIGAGETRRIVVRYAEWLHRASPEGSRFYRYPMGGGTRPPRIQELSIRVTVPKALLPSVRAGMGAVVEDGVVTLARSDFEPRADFWLELTDRGEAAHATAYRADHSPPRRAAGSRLITNEADERDYFYLPVVLPPSLAEGRDNRAAGLDLVLVADVSAATDRARLELGRSVIESLVSHLGENDRVAIVTSDLVIRPLGGERQPTLGPASHERLEQLLDGLARVPAGGATDLGAAISGAAALLDPARQGAIVYVGDGAPTVGELAADELVTTLGRLPSPPRLYAIGVGDEANLELLQTLTRGGGLALRARERADAGLLALEVLTHAARPLAQRVTVDLGTGIDNAFPRRPVDVVLGDALSVVGRIRGEVPQKVTVRGLLFGRPFSFPVAVTTQNTSESIDLRLRWANERLHQLLLENAGREAIAELGTRYGLITPFTSFYVPSAAEVSSLGAPAERLKRDLVERFAQRALGPASFVLGLAACNSNDEAARTAAPMVAQEQGPAPTPAAEAEGTVGATAQRLEAQRPQAAALPPAPPAADPVAPAVDAPARLAQPSEAAPEAAQARDNAAGNAVDDMLRGALGADADGTSGFGALGGGSGGGGTGDIGGMGGLGRIGTGHGYGGASPTSGARPMPSRAAHAAMRVADEERAANERDERTTATTERRRVAGGEAYGSQLSNREVSVTVRVDLGPAHKPDRCSDAARASLDDRRALWRERLDNASGASAWVDVYRTARRGCELPGWRDRRAMLDLILGRAFTIATMLDVYQLLDDAAGRGYLRGAIARRVHTPAELRLVRERLGLATAVDWSLVEQVLARATTSETRIRTLRSLIQQYPDSFDLKLRLLAELEAARRIPEARRLAETLRTDPLADAGVRTAIGEMFLRLGDEGEARRVFSEIVEFAPLDELARRRLGDLYRAYGWFEDAYRQYETLATIRPDDPSVSLLLAQAAAGAGRIDEALRLEQKLAETAEPGASQGIARTAILWSSVRFAKLRQEARGRNDEERVRALLGRMRRSGVLREAGDVRVTLTWSHPDASLSLWASYPGLALTRPDDTNPEFGIEAFDVHEAEAGRYGIEVRRTGNDLNRTVLGELVAVWHEGAANEKIVVIPVRFTPGQHALAWNLEGENMVPGTPSITGQPRGEVRAMGGGAR